MESLAAVGKWLLVAGVCMVLVGGLIWIASRIPGLQNLPGMIKIQGSGFTCLIPLLASILLSILLTVVLNLIIRWINR
jgi:hypothetical protein